MKQREARRKVLVRARIRCSADWFDVVIHNISSRGLLASAPIECRPGTIVEIRRVHHIIVGRIVWQNGEYFGLRTQDRIDIDGLVSAKPPAHRPGAPGSGMQDRRDAGQRITATSIAEREARSRRFASAFQFVLLVCTVGVASLFLAERVGHVLSAPFAAVSAALGGAAPRTAAADTPP